MSRAILLIADIGGYTRFMKTHRINLAHAQDVVGRLLESIIDGARDGFKLAKLEGDAAFFYKLLPDDSTKDEPQLEQAAKAIVSVRQAFLQRRTELEANRLCTCEGCVGVENLKLKFVGHLGEIAFQKVKRLTEVAGVDVILVHRLLKNDVPLPEYLLSSDSLHRALPLELREDSTALQQELEGLGPTQTHFTDLSRISALQIPLRASKFKKWWEWLKMTWRSIPYILGLKKSCDGFRNFPSDENSSNTSRPD